jgi:hypothetical protein
MGMSSTEEARMDRKRFFLSLLVFLSCAMLGFFLQACKSIQNYSTVEIVPDLKGIFILTPATKQLNRWDEEVALEWNTTYNRNIQVKSIMTSA